MAVATPRTAGTRWPSVLLPRWRRPGPPEPGSTAKGADADEDSIGAAAELVITASESQSRMEEAV